MSFLSLWSKYRYSLHIHIGEELVQIQRKRYVYFNMFEQTNALWLTLLHSLRGGMRT